MHRRHFLIAAAAVPLTACGTAEVGTFPTIAAAQSALDAVLKAPHRTSAGWPLPQVLEHAAQSIEYSLHGFPELKPAWFQHTAGAAAFAAFDAFGKMRHSLTEPIPGAPALSASMMEPAVARLKQVFTAFESHRGRLYPHFAYGVLSNAEYARAHLMHLANHWTEVVRA